MSTSFQMTSAQQSAATQAMGFSPDAFGHVILWLAAAGALIWLIVVIVTTISAVQAGRADLGEGMAKLGVATGILIITAIFLTY